MSEWEKNKEIQLLQEYLRIPSVHPDIDYTPCVEFLKKQSKDLNLPLKVYHPGGPTKPIVVITWLGQQPQLPSIMLNSHMDVVPVYPEKWTHPPFAAEIDEEGRIFARGSQDMKSIGMQYLAALRALKKKGVVALKRTIHVTFMPDEEISGVLGMKSFVTTDDFRNFNVGLCLDEGVANTNDEYTAYYAEKTIWYVQFIIHGPAGHGSLLHKNTAGEKLEYILNKMMDLRRQAEQKLKSNPACSLGDVNTLNLTVVKGGVQSNVVPPVIEATFDLRLGINADLEGLEKQLRTWCEEAGGDIDINFKTKDKKIATTFDISDTNPFWVGFKTTMEKLGLKLRHAVLPGVTDVRYLRELGIPALNFSPMANTPILLHDHDEFLKVETYLKGIEIYENLLATIANV
ncbi:aminoacylase-1-like [Rhagoletis pomonella]|uniref:aminoacylase-1-like n=1 Tax=Rhagoletis pomonella TaxID=28610 RepID=UPI00177D7B96|nr:aminoacylase-1-like [Rhagoletis pomonella]